MKRLLIRPENSLFWRAKAQIKKQVILPVKIGLNRAHLHEQITWMGPDPFSFHDGKTAFKSSFALGKEGYMFGIAEPFKILYDQVFYPEFGEPMTGHALIPFRFIRHWYVIDSLEVIPFDQINKEERECPDISNSEYFEKYYTSECYLRSYFHKHKITKINA